ncbi:MAG: hypothetical protein ABWJ97_05350 [Thermoproteus sp.]
MTGDLLLAAIPLALAAVLIGAFVVQIGSIRGAPGCSDCVFYVRGPAALIQTEGSAYLVRGYTLANSSILAQYAWAYWINGSPLAPGGMLACADGMYLEVVDGVVYAKCLP